MEVLFKKPYGSYKPGKLIGTRRTFYEKLLALDSVWPEADVLACRKHWYTVRPRPKGYFGNWAHALLLEKYNEAEAPEPTKTKPTRPEATAAKTNTKTSKSK